MAKPKIPYALNRGEAIHPGLLRILKALGKRATVIGAKTDSDPADSVHELRTLIKRLRAFLWFLRPVLGAASFSTHNRLLRQTAQSLSSARDVHAVKSALSKAALKTSPLEKRRSLIAVAAHLEGTEDEKEISLVASAPVKASAATIVKVIAAVVSKTKQNQDSWPLPKDRVKVALRSVRKAEKQARQSDDVIAIHDWRKKTKRLFYLHQLLEQWPLTRARNPLGPIEKLQGLLGDHQDAVVAEHCLREHAGEIAASDLVHALAMLKKSRKALFKDARRCWKKIRQNR